MLVELRDRLRVVLLELVVGDLVDPRAHRLAEQLAARLAADRVGDGADRVGGVYEAQRHRAPKIDPASDGKTTAVKGLLQRTLRGSGERVPRGVMKRLRGPTYAARGDAREAELEHMSSEPRRRAAQRGARRSDPAPLRRGARPRPDARRADARRRRPLRARALGGRRDRRRLGRRPSRRSSRTSRARPGSTFRRGSPTRSACGSSARRSPRPASAPCARRRRRRASPRRWSGCWESFNRRGSTPRRSSGAPPRRAATPPMRRSWRRSSAPTSGCATPPGAATATRSRRAPPPRCAPRRTPGARGPSSSTGSTT